MHETKEAEDRVNDLQPNASPAKDPAQQEVAPQAETVKPEAPEAFDPLNLVPRRSWLDSERVELTRALIRHVSKDDIRYNLTGIYIDGDAGVATDGTRLLVVRGYGNEQIGSGKILQVSRAGLMPFEIKGMFPNWRMILWRPEEYKHTFELRNFERLKRLRAPITLSITSRGITLDPDGAIVSFDLRYLTDLPSTDDTLFISVIDNLSGMLVRPRLGGWFAVIMPRRALSSDVLAFTPCAFEVPR